MLRRRQGVCNIDKRSRAPEILGQPCAHNCSQIGQTQGLDQPSELQADCYVSGCRWLTYPLGAPRTLQREGHPR